MRISILVLGLFGATLPTTALADSRCVDNFLSGKADGVIDAETGQPIAILPYATAGYAVAGYSYTIDLGGGYAKPVEPPIEPPAPPVEPGFMDDLALVPNDAGATRLVFPGDGTGRLTGPQTDFTFTGVDPTGLFVDGDLIARGGSGTINGMRTTAVPDANGITLRLGSGFNTTRTRQVTATFANGVVLSTLVALDGGNTGGGFSADLSLSPNSLNVARLTFPGDGTGRLTGPGTDFTFTGVDASAFAFDGPLVARGGAGMLNGRQTSAVQLIDDVAGIVLTLSSGFNPTGTQTVRAQFADGSLLEAMVLRN